MQTRQGVLRQLDQEWEEWQRAFTAVERSGDGEPVSRCSMASVPSERSSRESTSEAAPRSPTRSSWCSFVHAAEDDLAARTVLQAMMPAIKNLTSKFSTCGAWSSEETAAVSCRDVGAHSHVSQRKAPPEGG